MRGKPTSLLLAVALLAADLAAAAAQEDGGWTAAEGPVLADGCAAPMTTTFTAFDGRQLESSNLTVSGTEATWLQKMFFSDGAVGSDSRMSVAVKLFDNAFSGELPTALAVDGSYENFLWVDGGGTGGGMTFDIVVEGGKLEPSPAQRVLDWYNREVHELFAIVPDTFAKQIVASFRIWNSPCTFTWTWTQPAMQTATDPTPGARFDPADVCGVGSELTAFDKALQQAVDTHLRLSRLTQIDPTKPVPSIDSLKVTLNGNGTAEITGIPDGYGEFFDWGIWLAGLSSNLLDMAWYVGAAKDLLQDYVGKSADAARSEPLTPEKAIEIYWAIRKDHAAAVENQSQLEEVWYCTLERAVERDLPDVEQQLQGAFNKVVSAIENSRQCTGVDAEYVAARVDEARRNTASRLQADLVSPFLEVWQLKRGTRVFSDVACRN